MQSSASMLRFHLVVLMLLAVLALLWPAAVNSGPMMFPDTAAYVRAADGAIVKLTGHATAWTEETGRGAVQAGAQAAVPPSKPILAGRSVYYGAMLYLGYILGSFWLAAMVQALVAAVSITLFMRRFQQGKDLRSMMTTALVVAILAAATPVAFFSSYLMPDLFAGIAILAFAMLTCPQDGQRKGERLFWFLALAAACLFHSANLIIIAAMLSILVLLNVLRLLPISTVGLAAVAVALALGVVGEAGFSFAVKKATGTVPVRPPFITARIIEDGPGYRYTQEVCPKQPSSFQVCRYWKHMPRSYDRFLWDPDPRTGVFLASSSAEQYVLSSEQARFALAVVAQYPVEQFLATSKAALNQLSMIRLVGFNYQQSMRDFFQRRLPAEEYAQLSHTSAFANRMPVRPTEILTLMLLAASLIVIFAYIRRTSFSDREGFSTADTLIVAIFCGLLVNAVVCGGLSVPDDRYQARVIWLVPLLASGLLCSLLKRQRGASLREG